MKYYYQFSCPVVGRSTNFSSQCVVAKILQPLMLNKRNSIYFWLQSIMYLWFILSHMVGYSLCLTVHELSMPFREKYDRDICSRTFTLHKVCVSHYHSYVHKLYCQYKQFFICLFHGCNHILFLLCHILHILIRKHFVLRLVCA